jgi:DNA-binding beta-propeller fold protein YncE
MHRYIFFLNELFSFSQSSPSSTATNHTTNTVSCHKINGDKLWKFKDVAIIRSPGGVAVDKDLNVYLASIYNNSVE